MSRLMTQESARQVIAGLCERFGMAESEFDNYTLYQGAKGKVYLHRAPAPAIKGAAVIGLHIATVAKAIKPSTYFIQTFGHLFSRNVITVSNAEARELIAGQELTPLLTMPETVSAGYVALCCDGRPLLCGFLKNGELRNMLPKSRRRVLEFV